MTERRRSSRWRAAVVLSVLGLAGCTTTTLTPPSPSTAGSTTSNAAATTSAPDTTPGPTSSGAASEMVPSASSSSAAVSSAAGPSAEPGGNAPTAFTPAVDAEAVDGACPYLTKDQVQADTGQRMGTTQIRPAEPQPVCEFVRSDGGFLATVRVLQVDAAATAVSAVDFYVPRDASNPESRPAGWSGGSLATDGGSMYAVSKGEYAVIAETNQKQSVYARLLVVHAIENLGL